MNIELYREAFQLGMIDRETLEVREEEALEALEGVERLEDNHAQRIPPQTKVEVEHGIRN